jgi:2-keto-4-pentenoate hydratase
MSATLLDHDAVASELTRAERERFPILPISERWPAATVADAYRIQRAVIANRVSGGEAVVGHKVGLTSVAMQEQLGVDEPDFGHILTGMVVPTGAAISMSELIAPRVEPEIAFVLGADLDGRNVTQTDVLDATEYVVPALEVIDSRVSEWRIRLVDTVADNASSARIVLGETKCSPHEHDLASLSGIRPRLSPGWRTRSPSTGRRCAADTS